MKKPLFILFFISLFLSCSDKKTSYEDESCWIFTFCTRERYTGRVGLLVGDLVGLADGNVVGDALGDILGVELGWELGRKEEDG